MVCKAWPQNGRTDGRGRAALSVDAPMFPCARESVCVLCVYRSYVRCSTCTSNPFSLSLLSAAKAHNVRLQKSGRSPTIGRPGALHGNRGADICRTPVPDFPVAIVCYQPGTKTQSRTHVHTQHVNTCTPPSPSLHLTHTHTINGKVRESDPNFPSTPPHSLPPLCGHLGPTATQKLRSTTATSSATFP